MTTTAISTHTARGTVPPIRFDQGRHIGRAHATKPPRPSLPQRRPGRHSDVDAPLDSKFLKFLRNQLDALAARVGFDRYFSATDPLYQDMHGSALVATWSPRAIGEAAIAEFAEKGDAQRLLSAASLLARLEIPGCSELRRLSIGHSAESEYFLDALVDLTNRSEPMRRIATNAVVDVAQHGEEDTRWRLLNQVDVLTAENRKTVLELLRDDPVESLAAEAKDLLDG